MTKQNLFIHGEVNLTSVNELPKGATRIDVKDAYFVLGESETHGNDHRVALKEDIEIYELDGKIYVKADSETSVYCPKRDRHSEMVLPSGIWEKGIAQEYDHLAQEQRNVAD